MRRMSLQGDSTTRSSKLLFRTVMLGNTKISTVSMTSNTKIKDMIHDMNNTSEM